MTRAFWMLEPGRGALRHEALPSPPPGEVLVRTLASGISRGTEALVFAGRVPSSQFDAMRAPMMAGTFPFPVKYGYAAVGVVEAAPAGVGTVSETSAEAAAGGPMGGAKARVDHAIRNRVFVLHPHQEAFVAPAAMCMPVPDDVPTHRAVLAANMETALNLLWDAAPLAGERITVIGAGVVGLLAASLLVRLPATRVTLVDINPDRRALAERFGCDFACPADAPPEQELIVHASASEAGLRLALDRAAAEARIIEASWYGDAAPRLPLGEAFHARRLRLIASQVGMVASPMRGRRSHAERLAMALDLLRDPAYDHLLEGPTPFERLPEAMPRLLAPGGLCHVISYGTE